MLTIPQDAQFILTTLHDAGFAAYVVGGCVRDSFLGRTPGDWDVCTSALPAQVRTVFQEYRMILTGEKHGTVAVILHDTPYEITTFRVDGAYTDHRRPDEVHFVPDVREDLARRDFTINAMAYSPWEGLVDAFGGQADLQAKVIRCVGSPAHRFGEDALRILRAVRFAAQLDFTLEAQTRYEAEHLRDTLQQIAVERIFTELDKLLAAPAAGKVLSQYGLILSGTLPEIAPCMGCTQPGRWHCYDVWQHTAVAVGCLDVTGQDEQGKRILRWATLLHDIAKPLCRTLGADGASHFHGHNQQGAVMAGQILRRLKAPVYLIQQVPALITVHDAALPRTDAEILQQLNRSGPAFLQRLCRLKLADLDAHAPSEQVSLRRKETADFEQRMLELAQNACYSLEQLAVGGKDLLALGVPSGPIVGRTMHTLLEAVMQGRLPNERQALLNRAAQLIQTRKN